MSSSEPKIQRPSVRGRRFMRNLLAPILLIVAYIVTGYLTSQNSSAALPPVYGSGTAHYLAKWVDPSLPEAIITADSSTVISGGNTTIRWCTADSHACINAATCSVGTSAGGNDVSTHCSGTHPTGALSADTTYYLTTQSGTGASNSDSVTVTVTGVPPPPPLGNPTISANPRTVNYGGTSSISWKRNGNSNCSITGGTAGDTFLGSVSGDGSGTTAQLYGKTTYTIQCTSPSPKTASVTVQVRSFQEF